jgi:hypothetical protein
MSILDRVNITVARHKNDYFKNWTSQQLDDIDNVSNSWYLRNNTFDLALTVLTQLQQHKL